MAVETLRFRQITQLDTNNAPSPSIWSDCPWHSIKNGDIPGVYHDYEFAAFHTTTDVNASEAWWEGQGLAVYGTTTAPITAAAEVGGGITVGSSGDNGGLAIRQLAAPYQIIRTGKRLWWECRLKTSTIADAKHDIFVGLIENTAASTSVPITTAGAIADKNLVGFFRPESARTVAGTGGAIMNTVYKADGVTAVNVQTDAVTLAADTYVKLGMKFEPLNPDPFNLGAVGDGSGKYLLTFFANGVMLGTPKQIPTAAGTDFPNDIGLGFIFALMNATGATPGTCTLSWARMAQLI